MTEFEQQVAEAMCRSNLVYGSSVSDPQACQQCHDLAPKVAAAIELVAREYAETVEGEFGVGRVPDGEDYKKVLAQMRQKALTVLRGAT